MEMAQVVLNEDWVAEGASAWRDGEQRWRAWNAVMNNHVRAGRLLREDIEAHVTAAVAVVRQQDRQWLDDPDIR